MYPTMVNFFQDYTKRRSNVRKAARASSDAGPELAGRESHHGDGKPAGPDHPLEKGVRGIKKERAERQGLGQRPNTKKRESSDERLKTLPKNGGFLLSHLVWQYHRR